MKPFNFKSIRKTPWRIELPDGTKLTLQPCSWGEMRRMDESIRSGNPAEISKLVARLLSVNLEEHQVTAAEVDEQFDAVSIKAFIEQYSEYIGVETNQKN